MIPTVISLLSAHLAIGSLLIATALVIRHRLPDPFLRFCTAGSAFSAGVSWLLNPGSNLTYGAVAATAVFWYIWVRRWGGGSPIPGGVAVVVGLGALGTECLDNTTASWPLCFAGSVSSALLLGAVVVSMVLGHWYLVDTKLSIAPLKQGALWFAVAVVARWATVSTTLAQEGLQVVQVTRADDLVFSTLGLFFLFRFISGLIAPALLAGLIWQTVKMRSTQSATGLLYVAFILVLFGELIAQFLAVATGFPL